MAPVCAAAELPCREAIHDAAGLCASDVPADVREIEAPKHTRKHRKQTSQALHARQRKINPERFSRAV